MSTPAAGPPIADRPGPPDRRRDVGGQLVGAMICAGFGAAWALGCADELARVDRGTAVCVGAVGVLLGLTLLIAALLTRRRRARSGVPGRPNAMFASRGYRIVVAVEVLAIVAGSPALGSLGLGDYVVIWVAFVVGVHFLGFGVLFWRGYHLIGAVMLAGVAVAIVLALTGPTPAPAGVAVTGVCAVDLLVAGAIAVRDARRDGQHGRLLRRIT